MDLTGIAAIVALAAIPVTALVGYWQKTSAIEAVRQQAEKETQHWIQQARLIAYKEFQKSLDALRKSLMSLPPADDGADFSAALERISDAASRVHDAYHEVAMVAGHEVRTTARTIFEKARPLRMPLRTIRGSSYTEFQEHFLTVWRESISPEREKLDARIRGELGTDGRSASSWFLDP